MNNLLPKNKFDIETAEQLKNYSFEQIKPFVPELLTWLQDINYPVAKPVAEYLVSISENISDEIIKILKSDDEIWKYWVINVFGIWTDKKPVDEVFTEIKRISENPTENEIKEEVHDIAIEFITKFEIWEFGNLRI